MDHMVVPSSLAGSLTFALPVLKFVLLTVAPFASAWLVAAEAKAAMLPIADADTHILTVLVIALQI